MADAPIIPDPSHRITAIDGHVDRIWFRAFQDMAAALADAQSRIAALETEAAATRAEVESHHGPY